MEKTDFLPAFSALTGNPPFPWQQELFTRFATGRVERSLDIPTGLGKTAVIVIWLLARAAGAVLPRRLAYVVDRRAVVDQATDVALGLRKSLGDKPQLKQALGLDSRPLPISTLRGQHVDNKEWLEDPTSPAIIVGTVDMIGSRLLFEGYGTSRKMRPYHAGLIGVDTLVVLDEAHLVPPFEKLLQTIADGHAMFGPSLEALREHIPPFKLLSLSATGRGSSNHSFSLQDADLKHPVVKQRLDARKRLMVRILDEGTGLSDALTEAAWMLADNGTATMRIILFCNKREDAAAAQIAIEERAKGNKREGIPSIDVETELFVGGRRVFEREEAARWLKDRGFLAGSKVKPTKPTFLFATSAGEVGVDLDADHMVSDLVAWERMIQRLGRVNRRGDGDASVVVFVEPEPKPRKTVQDALAKDPNNRTEKESKAVATYETSLEQFRALRKPLQHLPCKNGECDASPGAIRELKKKAAQDASLQTILDAATTPAPLRPALTRPLVDAWSMTSLKEHTGRPEINPWLRGWIENEPPQTSVIWRKHLPVRKGTRVTYKEIESFFEAAPPHRSEMLETETFRVVEWLENRAEALLKESTSHKSTGSEDAIVPTACLQRSETAAIALNGAGDVRAVLKLDDLVFDSDDKKANERKKADLERHVNGAMLVVDARIAGLSKGLLDHKNDFPPCTVDDGNPWLTSTDNEPVVRFRVRVADTDTRQASDDQREWRQRFQFAIAQTDDGEPSRWLIVEKWLDDAATEDDRSEGRPQLLNTHQQWAECRARQLAMRLGLPDDYANMLAIAARLHDEGKRAKRWQRAFNAPGDGNYAKTLGPVNIALLDGYRHEFGSLPVAQNDGDFLNLPSELQDLTLHLIAAHHGFARPIISVTGCEDAPPSALEERARGIALRFARLQQRWGPWGLAWWESLLRAIDQQASRDNEVAAPTIPGEDI